MTTAFLSRVLVCFLYLNVPICFSYANDRDNLKNEIKENCDEFKDREEFISKSEESKDCRTVSTKFADDTQRSSYYKECNVSPSIWNDVLAYIPPVSTRGTTLLWSGGKQVQQKAFDLGEGSPNTYRPLETTFPGYIANDLRVFCTDKSRQISTNPDVCPKRNNKTCITPTTRSYWVAVSRKYARSATGVVNILVRKAWFCETSVLVEEVGQLDSSKVDAVNINIFDAGSDQSLCDKDPTIQKLKEHVNRRQIYKVNCYITPLVTASNRKKRSSQQLYYYENPECDGGHSFRLSTALATTLAVLHFNRMFFITI